MQSDCFCMRSPLNPDSVSKVVRCGSFKNSASGHYPGYTRLSGKIGGFNTYFLHSYKRSALLKKPVSVRRPRCSDSRRSFQTLASQSEVEAEEPEANASPAIPSHHN